MQDQNTLFSLGLGLQDPWYIDSSELVGEVMTIKIGYKRGAKFADPVDGEMYGVYRTNVRKIKHLFMRQYETILEVRIPEIKTMDGSIKTVKFPLCDKGSGFTYLFEGWTLSLAKAMPVDKVAKTMKENYHTIMRIINKYVVASMANADYSSLHSACIDETSTKKGHNYITSIINIDTRKVSAVVVGKGKETIHELMKIIENHGGDRKKIERVCIDLSPAFIAGCKEYIPNAEVVYDVFHVMQFVQKAMDEVRKEQARINKGLLEKTKRLWLKDSKNLKEDGTKRLQAIMRQNEPLALAYQLKEDVKELFRYQTIEEAERYFDTWCDRVMKTLLRPYHEVVKTFKKHKVGILGFITHRITNGLMEGTNGIIQGIKNRARGYTNINNFITMIYLHLGDFTINTPT